MCFSDRLHRIDSPSVFLPHLHDFSKGAFTDHLQELKRFDSQLCILGGFECYLEMESASSISCIGFMPRIDERLEIGENVVSLVTNKCLEF